MRLTMVGTGYVGLVTGVCLANTGNDVTCLDVDAGKIEKLKQGICPIYEPGLTELMVRNYESGRLKYTLDKAEAYRDADMIFICVGTPPGEDGSADLQYVLQAAGEMAEVIKELGPNQSPKTVVVKSTVPVGTTFKVRDRIREIVGPEHSLRRRRQPRVPERRRRGQRLPQARPGCLRVEDHERPDNLAAQRFRELYEPFVRNGHPVFIMDVLRARDGEVRVEQLPRDQD